MRVALVSTYLPQKCGIATYTDYLAQGLYKLALSEYPELSIKILGEKGTTPFKKEKFEVYAAYHRDEDFISQLLSFNKEIDVLHFQNEFGLFHLDDRLPNLLEKISDRIKTVITWHAIIHKQFSAREPPGIEEKYIKKVSDRVDEVIVHMDSHKSIIERLGIPSEKIHVIPHGTEICDIDKKAAREKLGLPLDKNILCMMGFIKRHKRYHVAIETLAEIVKRDSTFILHLAGGLAPNPQETDVKYVEELKERIIELNLQNNVIFPNKFFPNEDIPFVLSSSDVILLPYLEENRAASGPLHLAAGADIPVVASRIAKFEELKQISDGLLCLPNNYQGMARVVFRLCNDPHFAEFIQERIKEFKERTSWENVCRQHIQVYKKKNSYS